jgi:predicted porin
LWSRWRLFGHVRIVGGLVATVQWEFGVRSQE